MKKVFGFWSSGVCTCSIRWTASAVFLTYVGIAFIALVRDWHIILEAAAMGVPLISIIDLVGAGSFAPGITLPSLCVLRASCMVGKRHSFFKWASMYLNSSIVRGFLLLGSAKSLASLMIS